MGDTSSEPTTGDGREFELEALQVELFGGAAAPPAEALESRPGDRGLDPDLEAAYFAADPVPAPLAVPAVVRAAGHPSVLPPPDARAGTAAGPGDRLVRRRWLRRFWVVGVVVVLLAATVPPSP